MALTSFPYVHFHPGFPYSVFMGPGGAQANLPQMYWKTIGTSVDTIYRNTWTYNKVYGRPIYPLGQTYSNPSAADVRRFRLLAGTYGATGLSWWVWQFSGARQWTALGSPFSPFGTPVRRDTYPLLKRGYRSDLVVWLQQHLMKAGLLRTVNGNYGSGTETAVRAFQTSRGLLRQRAHGPGRRGRRCCPSARPRSSGARSGPRSRWSRPAAAASRPSRCR